MKAIGVFVTVTAVGLTASACVQAQQGGRFRVHTATQSQPLVLIPATQDPGDNEVVIAQSNTMRVVRANGIPDHLVGAFPNPGNPNRISEQDVDLSVPMTPRRADDVTWAIGWVFGVSTNGVVFDPFAGEFWQGNPNSGWTYEALGGAVALGLDANYAHVQPDGTYHYHGVPTGLLDHAQYDHHAHSPLIGYAADGYPIYAFTGVVDGRVTEMVSGWRLRQGQRPGGSQPDGAYDGAFVQDWEYVPGFGNLDQCNGGFTTSAEYPGGTYAYFITEDWPMVPRCFTGVPSTDFRKGPPA